MLSSVLLFVARRTDKELMRNQPEAHLVVAAAHFKGVKRSAETLP